MTGISVIICSLIMGLFSPNSPGSGGSRIEILKLESTLFGNTRNLRVYLPPHYRPEKAYKVLYLNDGQNVFGGSDINTTSDWRVDEITDSLLNNNSIEPVIIVAIDNIGLTYRGKEYLPWEDIYLNPPIPHPQGKKYPEFLINEVMPLIESKYNIKKGKENTGIGGFSYGGLIAAYTALTNPDHFGFLLVETPSLYVNNQQLLKEAENSKKGWPDKVYAGVGTNELGLSNCDENNEDNKMAVNDIQTLLTIIRNQSPHAQVHLEIAPCATHSFQEASKRLPAALLFLLNKNSVN